MAWLIYSRGPRWRDTFCSRNESVIYIFFFFIFSSLHFGTVLFLAFVASSTLVASYCCGNYVPTAVEVRWTVYPLWLLKAWRVCGSFATDEVSVCIFLNVLFRAFLFSIKIPMSRKSQEKLCIFWKIGTARNCVSYMEFWRSHLYYSYIHLESNRL